MELPREKNPQQPVETYDRYPKLMKVAEEIDPRLPLALTLAESTGRRIGAILMLRREDLDLDRLPHGWVRFRAEHDKTGHEQWVPLTQLARRIVLDHLQTVPVDEWLFPSTTKPSQPINRRTMDRRLIKAYERAGLERLKQGLWHPAAGEGRGGSGGVERHGDAAAVVPAERRRGRSRRATWRRKWGTERKGPTTTRPR